MTRSTIGDSPRRREDARFITGGGAYLDDLRFERLAHAVVLRSPHAHAWIHAIDVDAARRAPGVLAVLTAADAARDGLGPLRPYAEANVQTGEPFAFAPQPLIADGKVRFAGEAVALVVAETHAQALDAAELVAIDYEPLPAVTIGRRRPGSRRAADRRRGARQCLHRLAHRRCRRRRCRLRQGRACRHTQARQSSHRHQPDGAARRRRTVRPRERPLHAARLQPEHPHQPQSRRAHAGRRPRGCALHRARCRRRLRRQELRLRRAFPAPVGRQAHRPAGKVGRQPQRSVPGRPRRARHAGRGRAGARRGRQVPGAQGRERRQSRRLHGGRRRRRADLPVRPSAGHGVPHPRDRAPCRGRPQQHRADRRHARTRLRRNGEHPGTPDRRRGASARFRPRRAAAPATWCRPTPCR